MQARLHRFGLYTAALALLGLTLSGTAALADLSCSIDSVAGISPPAKPASANPKGFRIFWHIATQIEDIADAAKKPADMTDIRTASKLVDGYYFNVLLRGALIYWPDRPKQCELNFKRIGPDTTLELDGTNLDFPKGGRAQLSTCLKDQSDYLARQDQSRDTPMEVQFDALRRVADVLKLKDARSRGLPIWGEIIIRNSEFSYDGTSDKVSLNKLPRTYCGLTDAGFLLDGMMVYQEPVVQEKQGSHLWIPRKTRNGRIVYSDNFRRDKIPENARAFGLIADAFEAAHVPARNMRPNIRRWNAKRSPKMIEDLVAIPQIGGFNFEGGSRIISSEKKNIDNFVEGMSWILRNTDRDISLLMPGYWTIDQVGNDAEIDGLISRVRTTLMSLNTKLGRKMGLKAGQNAICTSRLVFIPATYGRPIHVRTLPMMRNGHLAGTVTGQIKLMSDIRKELCGVRPAPEAP